MLARLLMLLAGLLSMAGCFSPPPIEEEPEKEPLVVAEEAPEEVPDEEPPEGTDQAPLPAPEPEVAPEPDQPLAPFVLEDAEPWKRPEDGVLGTRSYPPTETEMPFWERVYPDAIMGMGPVQDLPREVGKYGGWFGIVRGLRVVPERNETRILCESKWFDGLTDTHILCISYNGGGDFVAVLPGTDHKIQALALLRVYGKITSVKDDVPRVRAEYARHFRWGRFCFMYAMGKIGGNQEWRERFCKVDFDDDATKLYEPFPDPDYYIDLLGHPEDFLSGKVEVVVPLD